MTDIQNEICRRLTEGESLRTICATEGMPSKSTVMRWLADDEEFRGLYAAARTLQADILTDEILDISDNGSNDWMQRKREDGSTDEVVNHEHISRSRLRVDSRKWLASKLAPKKYGDATLLKVGDAEGGKLPLDDTAKAAWLAALVTSLNSQRDEED